MRIIYYMLREGTPYPGNYFNKLDQTRIQQHHVRRFEQFGDTVTLTPAKAA